MIGRPTKLKGSKHILNADVNPIRKENEHESSNISIENSSRDKRKNGKNSNHQSLQKTHRRHRSSNQSCWSEESDIAYQPHSCDSSKKLQKQSNKFKLNGDSSQNCNSRSSTPISHSSSRTNI